MKFIQDYDVILVKTPQPNADSIGPLVNQGLAGPVDRGVHRRGSLSTPLHHHHHHGGASTTQHHPSFVHTSQRGSLAKIHDMNKEAPITKVQSQVRLMLIIKHTLLATLYAK